LRRDNQSALKYLFDNGVIMNQAFMVSIIIGICVLSGCEGSSSYDKKYNETRAMSFLKKYQTANSLYQVEYGSYTSLKMLYEDPPHPDNTQIPIIIDTINA